MSCYTQTYLVLLELDMIKYTTGNILESNAEALVNTVNTVGVMGKGIALAFKKAFPDNYKIYRTICQNKEFSTGQMLVTETGQFLPRYIINFPTKEHWRNRSKVEYVEKGMTDLVRVINKKDIKSIAIPPLGCGNGGLEWSVVKAIILNALEEVKHEVEVIIYEPGYNNQSIPQTKKIKLTPARAMLLTALKDYQVLDYDINLLVIQKTAYFLQKFGEPLNLEYSKGWYGPYSHRLQHLVKYLNGYFLKFSPEENKPDTLVELAHTDEVLRYTQTQLSDAQKQRLQRLKSLMTGFESPFGLELLATVDFIREKENIENTEDIIARIGDWTQRKKEIMKTHHITVANQRIQEYSS